MEDLYIPFLKSKLYGVHVTDVNIDYEGSITIDRELMETVSIECYEQVHVLNKTNGSRFITYAIPGDRDVICVNGAAARLVTFGDELIILSYCLKKRTYSNDNALPLIFKK
jgi:aspartate 1-decarboxylase